MVTFISHHAADHHIVLALRLHCEEVSLLDLRMLRVKIDGPYVHPVVLLKLDVNRTHFEYIQLVVLVMLAKLLQGGCHPLGSLEMLSTDDRSLLVAVGATQLNHLFVKSAELLLFGFFRELRLLRNKRLLILNDMVLRRDLSSQSSRLDYRTSNGSVAKVKLPLSAHLCSRNAAKCDKSVTMKINGRVK